MLIACLSGPVPLFLCSLGAALSHDDAVTCRDLLTEKKRKGREGQVNQQSQRLGDGQGAGCEGNDIDFVLFCFVGLYT